MTDTIDIDAMKRDMEAGTPGPWDLRLFQSGTVQVIMREWTDGKPNPMSGGSTYGYHSAYLTMNNIGQRNETDTDNEKYHNARRIARVPTMEAEILRLREGLEAIRQYGSDTLDGPSEGTPDDREWQRSGVLEMTDRADRVLSGEPWKKEALSHD